jgi:hypothetical protein
MLLPVSILAAAATAQHVWAQEWKPCNEALSHANCDLRQKATLFGHTVYSPDYAGIDPSDCEALRKPWASAVRNWPFQSPPIGPTQESQRRTSLVVFYSTRTYAEEVAPGTTRTLASRVATRTSTLTPLPPWALPAYPIAAPCSVPAPADCAARQAAARAADPTGRRGVPTWRNPREELAPACTRGCGRARVVAEGVEVLHWPTPAPASVRADGPARTITAGVAGGVTVFDVRTPVVRFATVRAEDNCGPVGAELHGATVRPSSPLSTGSGTPYHAPQSTWLEIDYSDFNQPIKNEVYEKLAICRVKELCVIPVVNAYNPFLQLPAAVRSLDPAWSNAYLDVYGYPMTAVALTPTIVPRPS